MESNNLLITQNNRLKYKSNKVMIFDFRYQSLISEMKNILLAKGAYGIAAPQLGVMEQIILVKNDEEIEVYFNPKIKKMYGLQFYYESCISIPNKIGLVRRPYLIELEAKDQNGNYIHKIVEGFNAITMCHEIDHLNGILFIDRAIEVIDANVSMMMKIRKENPWKIIDKNKKFVYEKRNF